MTVLARLLREPNGAIVAKAYCDFRGYVATGLLSEKAVSSRILDYAKDQRISEHEAITAIKRGIAAARKKPRERN
jgi:hypothetical protein